MAFDSFRPNNKKAWCEECGQQGHRYYECPNRLFGSSSNIFCSHCGSKSHPTVDCKDKSKIAYWHLSLDKKKGISEELTIEEDFHKFMTDLKSEKD